MSHLPVALLPVVHTVTHAHRHICSSTLSHFMVCSSAHLQFRWLMASWHEIKWSACSLGWREKETLTNIKYLYSEVSGANYIQLTLSQMETLKAVVSVPQPKDLCFWLGAHVHLKNTHAHKHLSVAGNLHEDDVRRRSPFPVFSFNRFGYIAQTVRRTARLFPPWVSAWPGPKSC